MFLETQFLVQLKISMFGMVESAIHTPELLT